MEPKRAKTLGDETLDYRWIRARAETLQERDASLDYEDALAQATIERVEFKMRQKGHGKAREPLRVTFGDIVKARGKK
jgi:hypothetical protein